MTVLSRLAIWQVLAAALLITLGGFGSPVLQAKEHGSTQQQKGCPTALREKPTLPPAETCCPVDPKDVHKAQKAADHAQHEAAEACKRQQQAAQRAQRKVDEAQAKGNKDIDNANAKLEQRKSESTEASAKLDSLTGPSESVAQAQSQPEADIMRSKPEPAETPAAQATPESSETNKGVPMTAEAAPAPAPAQVNPAPAPAPEMASPTPMSEQKQEKPKALPKTASPMGLIGLIGLASMSGGYLIRFFRR
jgi:hypothetical protein